MNPTIHVFIPTYNRPAELRRQLDRLAAQIDEGTTVFVNDNGSTSYDLQVLAREYPSNRFRFSRNAVNIGANANISLAYSLAGDADYLWILSDNDTLKEDGFRVIREYLAKDPDLLVFHKTAKDEFLVENPPQAWDSHCPGLISEAIYKSSVFVPFAFQAQLYHNSSFPHLAVYYAARKQQVIKTQYSAASIFETDVDLGGKKGNYELSVAGSPVLVYLLPVRARKPFLRFWIRETGRRFHEVSNRDLDPVVFMTKQMLWSFIPFSYAFFIVSDSSEQFRNHLLEGLVAFLKRFRFFRAANNWLKRKPTSGVRK